MKAVTKTTKNRTFCELIYSLYMARGFTGKIQADHRGRYQVWIRGARVHRNSPSGRTVSFGGKVPRLLDIAPLYAIAQQHGLLEY